MKLNIFVPFHTRAKILVQGENLSAVYRNHVGSSKQRGKKNCFRCHWNFRGKKKKLL